MKKTFIPIFLIAGILLLNSCKKENKDGEVATPESTKT
jgi:hypothetical protein